MVTAAKVLIGVLLTALVAAVGASTIGSARWGRATRQARDAILGTARPPQPADTVPPAPVRRYLEWAAPPGHPAIRLARVRQAGEFLLNPPDDWAPFSASQLFGVRPPAMLWDATIQMLPLVSIRVRDSYIDGIGSMHGAVLGLFTVLRDRGPSEMARASLMRYLAEAAWFPSRLQPSDALSWRPVDDTTAVATLRDGAVTVSLEFRFDASGAIRTVYAERRFRGHDLDPAWAPWIGRFSEYRAFDGYRVPTRGVVAWVIEGEERPYWRGRIDSVRYQY